MEVEGAGEDRASREGVAVHGRDHRHLHVQDGQERAVDAERGVGDALRQHRQHHRVELVVGEYVAGDAARLDRAADALGQTRRGIGIVFQELNLFPNLQKLRD